MTDPRSSDLLKRLQAARDAYRDAMAQIPAVREGYARLEALRQAEESQARDRSRREWGGLVQQGNVFFEGGSFRESLQRYQQALSLLLQDEALSRKITENIRDAGYRLLAGSDSDREVLSSQLASAEKERDAALARVNQLSAVERERDAALTRLRELRAQYQSYVASEPAAAAANSGSPQSLSTLLQAKILVREILDTEPVRSRYPELGATLERYFTALASQKETDGRRTALQELDALLARLTARGQPGTPPALTSYRRGAETDPLLALLNRLETLLQ